jgi:hypothetical protein
MLNVITNPSGIDVSIKKLQTHLFERLLVKWNILSVDYDSYGRVYRNKKNAQYIAEVFTGQKNDYKDVYWDDKRAAISWFGISGQTTFDKLNKTSVHLVFFVNLKKLKPTAPNRADEEVRNDVQKLIGNSLYGFSYEGCELWIDNVLREYPGSRRDERLIAVDMHPVHCFRLNLSIMYSSKNC